MSPHWSSHGAVKAFCERHHIARLALFGSAIRDDFDADTDVDVLVEFQPNQTPGLNFVSMERELSASADTQNRQLIDTSKPTIS